MKQTINLKEQIYSLLDGRVASIDDQGRGMKKAVDDLESLHTELVEAHFASHFCIPNWLAFVLMAVISFLFALQLAMIFYMGNRNYIAESASADRAEDMRQILINTINRKLR